MSNCIPMKEDRYHSVVLKISYWFKYFASIRLDIVRNINWEIWWQEYYQNAGKLYVDIFLIFREACDSAKVPDILVYQIVQLNCIQLQITIEWYWHEAMPRSDFLVHMLRWLSKLNDSVIHIWHQPIAIKYPPIVNVQSNDITRTGKHNYKHQSIILRS